MRIGITGATGFIGQCLLRDYAGKHEFVAFTPNETKSSLFRHPSVSYMHIDRMDASVDAATQDMDAFSELRTCDAAVNLGFARPRVGKGDSFDDYIPSILATSAFLRACAENGLGNIVHVSTRSVYGLHMPVPHNETEAIAPFSNYGAAKTAAESIASVFNETGKTHIKILRFAQIIGAGEYQGVVAASMKAAHEGRPLQIWGEGTETRCEYLYVRDAASAVIAALEHPEAKGVFNIGTGIMTTVVDLVAAVQRAYDDCEVLVERHPEKQVAKRDACMDVGKACEVLDWQASYTLQEALIDIRRELDSQQGA